MEIGVGELLDGLDRCLAEVRQGRVVVVVEHGCPIARIEPERVLGERSPRRARTPKSPAPQPVTATGLISELVVDQRR